MSIRGGRALSWGLAVIFGLGPIYWFPGVPQVAITAAKIAALTTFVVALLFNNPFRTRERLAVPLVILLWAATISSLYHGDAYVFNAVALAGIAVVAAVAALNDAQQALWKSLEKGVLIFTFFALVVIFDGLTGGSMRNPFYEYPYPLYLSGFQGGRTGWGSACGFMMAVALIAALNAKTPRRHGFWLAVALVIAVNPILVGTRGGTLGTALLFLAYGAMIARSKGGLSARGLAALGGLLLLLAGLIIFNWESIQYSRVWTSFSEDSLLEENSRITGYAMALDAFAKHPLAGFGEFSLEGTLGYNEIHNLWLRLMVERGVFAGLITSGVLIFLLTPLAKNRAKGSPLLLIAGLVPTMFEPTAIFGNFFSTFAFWMASIYLIHVPMTVVRSRSDLLPVGSAGRPGGYVAHPSYYRG